jgi:hypothetical protein
MSDSLRTDGSHATDTTSDAGRDEKIEQLLLAGLDHYFASRYEQAINVWTRALFLDRNHARARAYIDRARRALAEKQRESEELFQRGAAAYGRGDNDEAKRLLLAAIDGGAPADEAHALLNRLNHEPAPPRGPQRAETRTAPSPIPRDVRRLDEKRPSRILLLTMACSLVVAVALGAYALTAWDIRDWSGFFSQPEAPLSAVGVPAVRDLAPPLPRRGEIALARARSLVAGGRLHEALDTLDMVRATDAEKPDAERLRAEIQRQLLGLPASPSSAARSQSVGQ